MAYVSLAGCPSPPVPENGHVSTEPRNYSVGDAVEWVCNDDHELVGKNTTTCCPSGWTGAVPQCVASKILPSNLYKRYSLRRLFVYRLQLELVEWMQCDVWKRDEDSCCYGSWLHTTII